MKGLIELWLRQSVALNIVFFGLMAVAALVVLPRVSVERYPNFSFGEVNVTTFYPGASAQEVERLVSRKLEDALEGMKELEYVRTTSASGRSEVHVKFIDDTDYDALYDELRFRILSAQGQLPVQNGERLQPRISLIETDEWLPTIQVNLISRDPDHPRSHRAITLLAEELEGIIEALPGVKDVQLLGEEVQQVGIELDPDLLIRHRVSFAGVESVMRRSWASQPAGDATTDGGLVSLRVDSRHRSTADLLDTVVRTEGSGRYLRLGELVAAGGIRIESQDARTVSRVDGRKTVACKVLKYESADAREISERVRATCERFLAQKQSEGIDLVYSLDSTVAIQDSLSVLQNSLILGVILVAIVLCFFVGWRNALLAVAGIPFAFLTSVIIMYALGYSLNELSLLAFVLVSGIIVDDAIVVLENIHRLRESGLPLRAAIVQGTAEVFWPVVNSTLTTIAAFLPLLIMSGIVGEFFAIIPKAVAIALAASLVEAMITLPVHVIELEALFGPAKIRDFGAGVEAKKQAGGLLGLATRIYDWVLIFNLRHKILTILITLALFAAACAVLVQSFTAPQRGARPILRIQFFPDETKVFIAIARLSGTAALEETDERLKAISRDIADLGPEVIANVTAIAGLYVDKAYKPVWAEQYGFLQIELPAQEDENFAPTITRLERDLAEAAGMETGVLPAALDKVALNARMRQAIGAIDDQRKRARAEQVGLEATARELASDLRESRSRLEFLSEHAKSLSQKRDLAAVRARIAEIEVNAADTAKQLESATTRARAALATIDAAASDELREFERQGALLDAAMREALGNDPERLALAQALAAHEFDVASKRGLRDPLRLLSLLRIDLERRFEDEGLELEISAQKGGPPTGADINVRITGANEAAVYECTDALTAWMRQEAVKEGRLPGVVNISDDRGPRSNVLAFTVDPTRAAEHGLSVADVVTFTAGAFDGAYVGEFRAEDDDLPMRMRIGAADREPLALLSQVISEGDGDQRVLLDDVATVEVSAEHAFLNRWGFRRSVIVQGDLEESSSLNPGAVALLVKTWFAENGARFPGVSVAFGGVAESTARSYRSMAEAFFIAVILIYFFLAMQFRSYTQPLIILSNVVFAFTGVVLMMAGVGLLVWARLAQPERALITVQGFIAIIGLTGVVVNDSIVLIDFINRLRAEGAELRAAVIKACHWRMRPILMTTLTTIAGLTPMALGIPEFSIAWSPMATCFAAGLAMATTLTLLVLPVLYELVARKSVVRAPS